MANAQSPRDQFKRFSFSGVDARVYAYFPFAQSTTMVPLESAHTLSVSVHESKGPVRALGHRGVKGFAKGIRTIGGSMLMTVVNDHPLRQLMQEAAKHDRSGFGMGGWSTDYADNGVGRGNAYDPFDYNNRIATLLPPFNLLVTYVTEGGSYTFGPHGNEDGTVDMDNWSMRFEGGSWLVKGVEIIDTGMVTSVHDILTEVTLSFQAEDFMPLTKSELVSLNQAPNPGLYSSEVDISEAIFGAEANLQENIWSPNPWGTHGQDGRPYGYNEELTTDGDPWGPSILSSQPDPWGRNGGK